MEQLPQHNASSSFLSSASVSTTHAPTASHGSGSNGTGALAEVVKLLEQLRGHMLVQHGSQPQAQEGQGGGARQLKVRVMLGRSIDRLIY